MKRLLATTAVALCLGATGCVQLPIFAKPGATPQDNARATLRCKQTAYATVPGFAAIGPPLMVAVAADSNRQQKQDIFNLCMEADGYYITGYGPPR